MELHFLPPLLQKPNVFFFSSTTGIPIPGPHIRTRVSFFSGQSGIDLSTSAANSNVTPLDSRRSREVGEDDDRFVTPGMDPERSGGKSDLSEELRKEAEEILEWDSLCERVSRFASTSRGRALCRSGGLTIGRNRTESQRLLDQTAAAVSLPQRLDFSGVDDVSDLVRLAVSGGVLGAQDLCAVERSFRSARRIYEQLVGFSEIEGCSERYISLLDIFRNCNFMSELVQEIKFCIDCNLAVILDQASPKLGSIRSERRNNLVSLESLLKSISLRIFHDGGIDSPLITKRRARMCVGIKASHKSLLPAGVVLGVSSSGMTYFMEPREAIDLNNKEVRLSSSEKAEEFAILSHFTSQIACSERDITYLMERIYELDLALARGAYSKWINGVCPSFSDVYEFIEQNVERAMLVDIEGIRHPLLLEPSSVDTTLSSPTQSATSSQLDGTKQKMENGRSTADDTVVPLDIKIRHNTKVVIISGPNTGGKTVTMKTLGLASLMAKAGIFLPAANSPTLPWFDQVLADIGDHQSLEHNLSTFSGHISRICKILEVTSKQSLVLLDEIGNGTDPSEGVALSISILQHLVGHVSLSVVTTHYADLSLLKNKDSRFENAAMEFCIKTLQPTYRILWGSTGNSNALSIARSIGFDKEVLDGAQNWVQKLLPDKQKERQGLLYQSLSQERDKLEVQAQKAAAVLLEIKKLSLEISAEAENLDIREAAIKSRESKMVQQEIKYVKSQMDAVVKNFENQLKSADPSRFNALMRHAETSIASIVENHCSNDDLFLEETGSSIAYDPQIGDQVYVKRLGDKLVTVVEVPGDDGDAIVQYGKIRIRVKRNDMKPNATLTKNLSGRSVSRRKGQVQKQGTSKMFEGGAATEEERASYGAVVQTSKNTVDLRGMRVEEASNHLNMVISGCRPYSVLFVVHGMGTGAIKECALGILRKHSRVTKFEEESPMNYGCTVAFIR